MESSDTGGVKPFSIAGRYGSERERLLGMDNKERAFRNQWLKDQILAHNEPVIPANWEAERYNIIRRIYKAPLDAVHRALTPVMGFKPAFHVRFWIGKGLMAVTGIYGAYYYFKYHGNDWTKKGGWHVVQSRKAVEKGSPGYPKLSDKINPSDYATRGFKESPI